MKSLKYAFLFCLVLVITNLKAADRYVVDASGNGLWSSTSTWSATASGLSGASVPTAGDHVYTNGNTVNVDQDVTIKRLFVAAGVVNGIVYDANSFDSFTITVTEFIAGYNYPLLGGKKPTVAVIGNSTDLTFKFTGTTYTSVPARVIRSWSVSAPFSNVIIDPTGGTITTLETELSTNATTGGEFLISNSLQIVSGIFKPNANIGQSGSLAVVSLLSPSTLDLSAANINGDAVTDATKLNNIIISGIVTTTNTHYFNTNNITLNSTGTINVNASGVNQTQGWWYQSTSPTGTISLNGRVVYGASADQSLHTLSYSDLILDGSGAKSVTSSGSVNISKDLTFNNNGVTLNCSRLVTFNGTGSQQIIGGGTANFNAGLTVNKVSGTLTIGQDINWQGVFNLNQGTLIANSNSTVTATGVASMTGSVVPSLFNLAVSGSGSLTSSSGNINLAGNFTNNGAFNSNNGTITFNGSTAQTISGSNTSFSNITSTNSLSVTVSSAQSITDALTLSSGVFNANGNLTLISTGTRDARIAQITGGATIGGNINVQRYLPNNSNVSAYRYLASPFTNATAAQWKSAFPITGTFTDGSLQSEWPLVSSVADGVPSAYSYNESLTTGSTLEDRYESFPVNGNSTSGTTLVNGKGYAVYLYDASLSNFTITGAPKTGTANVSVTAQSAGVNDGWNLIGNPYASPISWDNVTLPPGVGGQVSILDNTNTGTYAYYTQGAGVGIPTSFTGIIASSQAFWVKATTSSTIAFQENDKASVTNTTFYREGEVSDLLRIKMNGIAHSDELALYFKDGAEDISEIRFDAFKRTNPTGSINFSSLSSDGVKLAINAMSTLSCSREVKLSVDNATAGAYSFNFSNLSSFKTGMEISLTDSFTGKTQSITASATTYNFEITSDDSSYGVNRFKLNFGYPGVLTNLAVAGENVCSGTDSKVNISNSQSGVSYYASIGGNTISETMTGNGATLSITIPHVNLVNGENQVVVMASIGECSKVALSQVSKIITDQVYSVTSVKDGAKCQEGSVNLTAAGAPANGSYKWYESSSPDVAITGQTSASYTTPALTKSKTYLVSVVNSLGCEGEKKEVNAKITNFDNATITELNGTTLQSNYETGNQWYLNGQLITGATGKTIEVKESGIYKLNVTIEGGCETSIEKEMIVTGLETALETRQVYPNPVTSILSIKLPASNGNALGVVRNELGQTVGNISFTSSDDFLIGEFNFEEKMPGIYIVRITQGNSITNHKIIKK